MTSTPEASALFAPCGRLLRAGERIRQPELGDALERLAAEGPRPFYDGDIAAAIVAWLGERGGLLTAADLRAYEVVDRAPLAVRYRGRTVLTNPPPSAGGILIARALASLDGRGAAPDAAALVEVMAATQRERTPEFLEGLDDPAFVAAVPRARPAGAARVDDAYRRARRRRLGVLGDLLGGLGVGRDRSRAPACI